MPNPLFGRSAELAVLESALDRVQGSGQALVLSGEAGIGKSALLEATATMALERGMAVMTTTGVQAEGDLPFAGLHQLLRPVLDRLDELPDAQRSAIATAFGMGDGSPPELFLVALAALQLLADAAGRRPLVLLVEDAQWLDMPSADALAFAARRIASDQVLMLIAIREGHGSPLVEAHLPELDLGPLADREARELLRIRFPDLAPNVATRLLGGAAGNPLALLELPAALGSGARGGSVALPEHLALPVRLEGAFASKVRDLPPPTRTLLLVAALESRGRLAEIVEAAGLIDDSTVTVADLDPALAANLVNFDGLQLRFRHPLVRSAVNQTARVGEVHAAHTALATVLADDPDRSIWHRAAAVIGFDREVALELEETARRAYMRGGVEVAVLALERAAALVDSPGERASLLLQAAAKAAELGRSATVSRLLGEAESLPLATADVYRAVWLRELFDAGPAGDPARVHRLVETAARAADADADLALRLLAAAAFRCYWGGLGTTETKEVIEGAERLVGIDETDPRLLQVIAYASPVGRGAEVAERLRSDVGSHDGRELYQLGTAAAHAGWFDLAQRLLGESAARLRDTGSLGLLVQVLQTQAWSAIFVSDFETAMLAAEETDRLAGETNQPIWQAGARIAAAVLAAVRGESDLVAELTSDAAKVGMQVQAPGLLALAQYARGLVALGTGEHERAYAELRRIAEPGDPACHQLVLCYTLGDLAEAAARTGNVAPVRARMERLRDLGAGWTSPWFRGSLAYAGAQLAGPEDAERLYREALDLDSRACPFMSARLQLTYGEWLRRNRHVAASRRHLREARDAFDAFGIDLWGERARQELRASGESSRRRAAATLEGLTPQELQIAQLAAVGLSNREIGQRLYLSHRTVESHLYRVFPKLGISSRGQLAAVLERDRRGGQEVNSTAR
jgi:DNA-binding CsgD family transcriptional regulator